MASINIGIYVSATLLKDHRIVNRPMKKVWLCHAMKLPTCIQIKLVAATTAAGLMATM